MVRSVAFQSAARLHTESDSARHLHGQRSGAFAPAPLTSAKCQVRCSPPGRQRNVARPRKACSSLALRAGVLRRAVSSPGAAHKRSAGHRQFHHSGASGQQGFWPQPLPCALPTLQGQCSILSCPLTAKNCRLTLRSTGPIAACG